MYACLSACVYVHPECAMPEEVIKSPETGVADSCCVGTRMLWKKMANTHHHQATILTPQIAFSVLCHELVNLFSKEAVHFGKTFHNTDHSVSHMTSTPWNDWSTWCLKPFLACISYIFAPFPTKIHSIWKETQPIQCERRLSIRCGNSWLSEHAHKPIKWSRENYKNREGL